VLLPSLGGKTKRRFLSTLIGPGEAFFAVRRLTWKYSRRADAKITDSISLSSKKARRSLALRGWVFLLCKSVTRVFAQAEIGDRAIEPLYPSFFTASGALQVLTEPRYSQLKQALIDALNERALRPPVARALMQSDAWAAYDTLFERNNLGTSNDKQIGEESPVYLAVAGNDYGFATSSSPETHRSLFGCEHVALSAMASHSPI